jgi:hypothetical protein
MQWPGAVTTALSAITLPLDLAASRLPTNRFLRSPSLCAVEQTDASGIVADFPPVAGAASLQPVYRADAMRWLLRQCEGRKGFGTVRARRVLDAARRPLGWFVYYLRPGSVCEVLQLAATAAAHGAVLEVLLADAWRHGGAAMRGRLEHLNPAELARARCPLRWEGPATVIHSRRREIIDAVHRGDAFLSRLDGEWWMRFVSG